MIKRQFIIQIIHLKWSQKGDFVSLSGKIRCISAERSGKPAIHTACPPTRHCFLLRTSQLLKMTIAVRPFIIRTLRVYNDDNRSTLRHCEPAG
jgi:hypothetical protein